MLAASPTSYNIKKPFLFQNLYSLWLSDCYFVKSASLIQNTHNFSKSILTSFSVCSHPSVFAHIPQCLLTSLSVCSDFPTDFQKILSKLYHNIKIHQKLSYELIGRRAQSSMRSVPPSSNSHLALTHQKLMLSSVPEMRLIMDFGT